MKNSFIIFIFAIIGLLVFSCSNDYIMDGGVSNPNVNQTTLEYLKANPHHQFDTLLILVKAAGIENELTGNVTVFALTNYAFRNFVRSKQDELRKIYNDENYVYNFDSLKNQINIYRDTLRMYIVDGKYNRTDLSTPLVKKSKGGTDMCMSLKESKLYTEWVPNSKPKFLYYTKVVNGLDDPSDPNIPSQDQDVSCICQTSGIITTTGILHVLDDDHIFGFRKQ
ncbi:MAG: fasciclin domain-containing protein [Bacteroidota bacterium]|nr:fasciclin domain-containing protein [Bacteroidota bacterium]MDP4204462.1 fasciclin domain-containing protein [Bacteroidota bacterium]